LLSKLACTKKVKKVVKKFKKLSKVAKKLSKSCQKVVKKKNGQKFRHIWEKNPNGAIVKKKCDGANVKNKKKVKKVVKKLSKSCQKSCYKFQLTW
jgi:hypothetical protein